MTEPVLRFFQNDGIALRLPSPPDFKQLQAENFSGRQASAQRQHGLPIFF